MKKIICIGECSLDITIDEQGQPIANRIGGRIASTAISLANSGYPVLMASEISADAVGDIVMKYFTASGVDTTSVDRITEGRTPLNVFTATGVDATPTAHVRYDICTEEGFDIIWPRVDEGDIVLFGGYYTIDPLKRRRLQQFLDNCKEHKAKLIYAPGFRASIEPRITRVMTAVLENLEIANTVVAIGSDLQHIFGSDDAEKVYKNNIQYYCDNFHCINAANGTLSIYNGKEVNTEPVADTTDYFTQAITRLLDLENVKPQ